MTYLIGGMIQLKIAIFRAFTSPDMKIQKGIIFLFVLLFISQLAIAQTHRQKQMVSSTYAFMKNIEWPKEDTPFKIHVITTDEGLKNEFRSTSEAQKIAGRSVKTSFTNYVMIPQDADVIFVTNRYNATIPTLLDRIGGSAILLITDRYDKQRDVMINFLNKESGGLTFEINRANVTNQDLKIKAGMDELGGSDVDLAKIFKQVRDSVRAMELRANELKIEFDSMNIKTAVAGRLIRGQMRLIAERDEEIAQKQSEIDRQTQALDSLRSEFTAFEKRLVKLTETLDTREQELSVLGDEISLQLNRVEEGRKTLEVQNAQIAAQNEEIAEREEKLDEMNNVVSSQQSALVFLVLFLVVAVGLSILIFTAYRARKKAA